MGAIYFFGSADKRWDGSEKGKSVDGSFFDLLILKIVQLLVQRTTPTTPARHCDQH